MQLEYIFKLIRENKGFRKEISLAAPELVEKIYALYASADAPTDRIKEWLEANKEVAERLYLKYTSTQVASAPVPALVEVKKVESIQKTTVKKSLKGSIINIDRSEVAYKDIIEKLTNDGAEYTGFTVVPDIKDGKAIWSLFFY